MWVASCWHFSLNFSLIFLDLQYNELPLEPNAQKWVENELAAMCSVFIDGWMKKLDVLVAGRFFYYIVCRPLVHGDSVNAHIHAVLSRRKWVNPSIPSTLCQKGLFQDRAENNTNLPTWVRNYKLEFGVSNLSSELPTWVLSYQLEFGVSNLSLEFPTWVWSFQLEFEVTNLSLELPTWI